ncbi:MAG: hypothetical protein AAFQ94_28225 [Bacteroidota bacterium]
MDKSRLLLIVYWVFLISALLVFGYGLRFEEVKVEMTIAAMVLWVISYLLNRLIRHENKKKNE